MSKDIMPQDVYEEIKEDTQIVSLNNQLMIAMTARGQKVRSKIQELLVAQETTL